MKADFLVFNFYRNEKDLNIIRVDLVTCTFMAQGTNLSKIF